MQLRQGVEISREELWGENSGLPVWTDVEGEVCNFCAISSTKQNFAHLPLIDPAISFELCQADWVAQTNRARFSKTHPVFTQVSKPKKMTHHLYSYKNNQVLFIYDNSTLCINNTLQRSDCCLHPMPSSVWLQRQWHVCVLMLLVPSLACQPCCHTPKNISNRCHNYSNVTAAWPYQKENTYYIEIYMNIDIDGYDFTIFVYSFYSLFTQDICVCTVSEPFAYWHLCTDLQWTVMTLLNLGICKCSIVWCPEALVFILFFSFLFMRTKKKDKKNFCVWLWHTDQTSTVYCS